MMIRTAEYTEYNKEPVAVNNVAIVEANTVAADDVRGKVIRRYNIAKQILRKGGDSVRIIDIKKDRNDPDRKSDVYVFRDDDEFQKVFAEVIEENQKARESRNIGMSEEAIQNLVSKRVEEEVKRIYEMRGAEAHG